MCRLYSIPEPPEQGLVAPGYVCRTVKGNDKKEGLPMDNKMKQTVLNTSHWLNKHHVLLVCILSVTHIGLSCIHTRDSGRADLEPAIIY